MTRQQLEHLIRAASAIVEENELTIIGSQALLGQFPDAPASLLRSIEADIYPTKAPEKAIEIDGAIGERSLFHQTHGYYAHGVGPETATLPAGWEVRCVQISNENTGGANARCLEVHDLAVAKLVAGRPRDLEFLRELIHRGLARLEMIEQRLMTTDLGEERRQALVCRARALSVE